MPKLSYDSNQTPSVSLPKGEGDIVRLQLVVKPDQPGSHRVELLTLEGQAVFSADPLQSADSRAAINFDVPARLLKTGDYQVNLRRSERGPQEIAPTYYFRVQ